MVTTASQRRADTNHATLIAVTVNEFRRLFDALVRPPPHDRRHPGMGAIAPETPGPNLNPPPPRTRNKNDRELRLPY